MTIAPQAQALVFEDIDDAVGALRARGLRVSIARRLVLEHLFAADGPVSAEHVASAVAIDAASVYRNLEMLERHGLVHHVHLGHGPGLYVLAGRGEREYLYCDRCATVEAVGPQRLDPVRAELRRLFGYEVRFTHFPIVGLCPSCAAMVPSAGAQVSAGASPSPWSTFGHGGQVHAHPGGGAGTDEHGGEVHAHPGGGAAAHEHGGEVHAHPGGGAAAHEHDHSHGDHVHSHAHVHVHADGVVDEHGHEH